MPIMGTIGDRESSNYHQNCLNERKLQARRPSTNKGQTIFRPIPEFAPDGALLPMVLSETPGGLDFSNCLIETLVINTGLEQKWSGLCRPSDTGNAMDPDDNPWTQLYMRLKGKVNAESFDDDDPLRRPIEALFKGNLRAPFRQPQAMVCMQCVLTKYNSEELDKARPKQGIFLSSTAARAVARCLTKAYKEGIDVYHPEQGYELVLTPYKDENNPKLKFFDCQLGRQVKLSEAVCRKLWVPWNEAVVLHPFDAHIRALINCFGREIVERGISRRVIARALGEPEEAAAAPEASVAPATRSRAPAASSRGESSYDDMEIDDLPGEVSIPDTRPVQQAERPRAETAKDELIVDTELPEDDLVESGDDDGEVDQAASSRSNKERAAPPPPDINDPDKLAEYYEGVLDEEGGL